MQSLAAFGVGTLVGLTGIGGGALMTPLLVLVFGFTPAVAVGTDLLFAAVTKTTGLWVHTRQGTVEWRIVAPLAAGSLPAAALTLWAVHSWTQGPEGLNALIVPLLAVALSLTGVALLARTFLPRFTHRRDRPGDARERRPPAVPRVIPTLLIGALVGTLVSLTSIGAGALVAAALMYLFPRLPAVKVAGTDIAHAVPLAAVAGLVHWQWGSVDFGLLGSLLAGSLPGIWIGSRLGGRVPEPLLRSLLATLLIVVGVNLALK